MLGFESGYPSMNERSQPRTSGDKLKSVTSRLNVAAF